MVEVDDVEGLVDAVSSVASATSDQRAATVARARATADANSYLAQRELWRSFMSGFVASDTA